MRLAAIQNLGKNGLAVPFYIANNISCCNIKLWQVCNEVCNEGFSKTKFITIQFMSLKNVTFAAECKFNYIVDWPCHCHAVIGLSNRPVT